MSGRAVLNIRAVLSTRGVLIIGAVMSLRSVLSTHVVLSTLVAVPEWVAVEERHNTPMRDRLGPPVRPLHAGHRRVHARGLLGGFAWEGRMSGAPARALEEHCTMARAQHSARGYVDYVGCAGCAGTWFEAHHNDARRA